VIVCSKIFKLRNLKEINILLMKWKLCENKYHSGTAKLRISFIQKTKLVHRN
jgi:hypothetical protein